MANTTGTKHGGRKAGTPNRLTSELRTALKNVLHKELELLPQHFGKLEPKDRVELLVKLLPYAMPRVEPAHYGISEPSLTGWGNDIF